MTKIFPSLAITVALLCLVSGQSQDSTRSGDLGSRTGALASLLDGFEISPGPDASGVGTWSHVRELDHELSPKRIDPHNMFASLKSNDHPMENLIRGSRGYSSDESGQRMAGVFVGYSNSQGSNPGSMQTFSGAVEGFGDDFHGSGNSGDESNSLSALSNQYKSNQEQSQQQLQQQHQQQQQQQQQQYQQQQHKQQQVGQMTSDPNDESETQVSKQQQLFSNQQNIKNGIPGDYANDLKLPDSGTADVSQQPSDNLAPLSNHPPLTQKPNLGNPQQLIYPQQFGNTDQLTHQAFPRDTNKPNMNTVDSKQQSTTISNSTQPQMGTTNSRSDAVPTMTSISRGEDDTITSNIDNFKQQLASIQQLISQLQQQQQELIRQQQQREEKEPEAQKSTNSPPVNVTNTTPQAESETKEIGPARADNEDGVGISGNDFGNTAGALNGVSGEGQVKQPPLFVAGGSNDDRDNENNASPVTTMVTGNTEKHSRPTPSVLSETEKPVLERGNITTLIPQTPTTQTTLTDNVGRNPVFDPQAVNDLAKQTFNPLNPLYGVDLQQYLGYQTGSGNGGFDATKLNTLLAEQGMQLGNGPNNQMPSNGGQSNSGQQASDDRDLQEPKVSPTTSTLATTPVTTITTTPRTTTADSTTSTDIVATNPDTTVITKSPDADTKHNKPTPSRPLTIAPPGTDNQRPAPSDRPTAVKPNKPQLGNVGGGLNLMNPSSMIGMMSSGRPAMAVNRPRDIFRLDNDQGMFGNVNWDSTNQIQDAAGKSPWFGTNGPDQRLTMPLMANPLDLLGLKSSNQDQRNRRRRSVDSSRRRNRQADSNNVESSLSKAFGFDPNQFHFQAADSNMNNGLGGCCPTNNVNLGGRGTASNAIAEGHSGNVLTSDRVDPRSNSALSLSMSSDFGNTATSGEKRTSNSIDDHNDRGSSWSGQWPGNKNGNSQNYEGQTLTLNLNSNGGQTSSSSEKQGSDGVWDGSWASSWPGFQPKDESTQLEMTKDDTSTSQGGKIGGAIAIMIDRNMGGASSSLSKPQGRQQLTLSSVSSYINSNADT